MPRIGAKRGQPPLSARPLQFQKPGGGGAPMPERIDGKGAARSHPGFRGIGERASPSVLSQRFVRYTTVLRGFRLGARAVMLEHHKRRATTSGGLARPPFGSIFPLPRGVGNA